MPTKHELSTDPGGGTDGGGTDLALGETLVRTEDLQVHYQLRTSVLARLVGARGAAVRAVDGVTLELRRGEVLGLVGESGSGKTTLGRALLGLVRPTGGAIGYREHDLGRLPEHRLRALRRNLQMVFQDPYAALNPTMDLLTAVGHPLQVHGLAPRRAERRAMVEEALSRVGLVPADQFLRKLPAELSGGQRQRAVIARAIITGPELLVADEPISMLDMSVRAKILELLLELKNDLDLTYVYITHDLATAKFFCDRVAIMYLGRIVEVGPTGQIFADPKHPYTRALLGAVPDPDPERRVPRELPRGEIPDAAAPPHGCSFHPRCPVAFGPCGWEARDLVAMLERRWTRRGEATMAEEEPLVRGIREPPDGAEQVRLAAPLGRPPAEVAALLESMREDEPDDPFWAGVESVETDGRSVVVSFRSGVDPGLLPAGDVDVACHLYDPDLAP